MRDTARHGRDTTEIQRAWRAVKDVQPHLEALGLAGQRLKVIEHLTARLDRLWEEVVHRKAASDLALGILWPVLRHFILEDQLDLALLDPILRAQ